MILSGLGNMTAGKLWSRARIGAVIIDPVYRHTREPDLHRRPYYDVARYAPPSGRAEDERRYSYSGADCRCGSGAVSGGRLYLRGVLGMFAMI